MGSGAAAAARLASGEPAHYVVFDVIHTGSGDVTALPYRERRAILEQLFRDLQLGPPWTLCPMTTSAEQIEEWLSDPWAERGIEGVVLKPMSSSYRPTDLSVGLSARVMWPGVRGRCLPGSRR
ncbi:hypothetical protein AB8O64_02845 [Streptomyces sp. QH1-20]|uniref:ATP-dependent DNA ligase n=1 Tax=Streptomyces sp. QH1-20 TaxID=3240934 RepID=UPI003515E848